MTTIAYRDGVLAGDTLLSSGDTRAGEAAKVRELCGFLVGASGNWGVASEFFSWFEAECRDGVLKRPPSTLLMDDDKYPVSVLLVRQADGAVFAIDGIGFPYRMSGRFFAIGSGSDVALGAMEMGADAVQAVKAAAKFDCYTGGRVRSLSLK